jgi:hypothetical protein
MGAERGVVKVWLYAFSTLALAGDELLASCPGNWVGFRIGLDALVERKVSFLCRESNNDL